MSARNMVRNLRDSGVLDTRPPSPRTRRTFALVVAAVAFGFIAYFAATAGGPALMKAMEKKPAPVSFAKP